jgi:hypothetical protein
MGGVIYFHRVGSNPSRVPRKTKRSQDFFEVGPIQGEGIEMSKKQAAKKSKPLTEREYLTLALEGFSEIAKQSSAEIAKKGLVMTGSQGRSKINPNAKIFRDAIKTLESLNKRLRTLEREQSQNPSDEPDEFAGF